MNRKRALTTLCVPLALLLLTPVGIAYREYRQARLDYALIVAIKAGDYRKSLETLAEGASGEARDTGEPPTFRQALLQLLNRVRRPQQKIDVGEHLPALLLFCQYCVRSMNLVYLQRRRADLGPDIRVVRALLDHGAKVNDQDEDGTTPLQEAVCFHDADVCELLIRYGADVNTREAFGFTPLYRATDYPNVVKALLTHGADVNVRSARGHGRVTPLMYAAASGNLDVVYMFIEHGANAAARDEDGKTAIDFARGTGFFPENTPDSDASPEARKIIALLRKYGAK